MKQLQNNYTTPEQSKRLLELGVPVDSADCYYVNVARKEIRQGIEKNTNFFTKNHVKYMPCWSVGRLQEIFAICYKGEDLEVYIKYNNKTGNQVEWLIRKIEAYLDNKWVDFSKLNKQDITNETI